MLEQAKDRALTEGGITILEVRVRNFRCLRSVDVVLGKQTILIGENNSGKTSLLRAIHAAIGSGASPMTVSDVFLAPNETRAPRERRVIVDLLIRPVDPKGNVVAEFPDAGPWLAHFGEAVSQDAAGSDQVVLRAELSWDNEKGEYVMVRRFLTEWPADPASIEDVHAVVGEFLARRHIEPFELSYLDANRDIAREIRTGGSFWGRLVSDLGVSDELIAQMETQLSELNSRLIAGSEVLGHLGNHLNGLYKIMSAGQYSVSIAPVPRQLQDLSRGVDALISTEGGPSFPLESQGMGTRSLAALLTFRAFVEWKAKRSPHTALHPFIAIEEPEAHLQPQAQRAVFEQLRGLSGQWMVATHSPYICSQADLRDCRVFFKANGETSVRQLSTEKGETALSEVDLQRVHRQVMNTRGDMLFSRVLVLFEGETEEQGIPDFAERYFGGHPSTLGLSLIGVGGSGNYGAFIRLAKTFGIPWRVFSDGELKSVNALDSGLVKLNEAPAATNPRVTVIPNGWAFEEYMCASGRLDALIEMVIEHCAKSPKHRKALIKEWKANGDPVPTLIAELKSAKTTYGSLVAKALRDLPIPSRVVSLLEGVREDLDLGG